MAGARGRASFTMDLSALERVVAGGLEAMRNRQQLMEAIGEAMVSSTQQRFEEGKDPDGNSWEPTARGGQILADTANLKTNIVSEASLNQVVWGTGVEYGAIHQFGGEIKPKNKPWLMFRVPEGHFVRVKSVTIPARPYIGVSQDDREEIMEMMRSHLLQGFGG